MRGWCKNDGVQHIFFILKDFKTQFYKDRLFETTMYRDEFYILKSRT